MIERRLEVSNFVQLTCSAVLVIAATAMAFSIMVAVTVGALGTAWWIAHASGLWSSLSARRTHARR